LNFSSAAAQYNVLTYFEPTSQHSTLQPDTMPAAKGEEVGESSTSAAKKALTANANGNATYELPW
jgi:hypothetical protein